jgi:LmbE family N-acetylglucosaminyl deacetylase
VKISNSACLSKGVEYVLIENMILAPHPDDEILGCYGIIEQSIKNSKDLKIIIITNGDGGWKACSNLFDNSVENLSCENYRKLGGKRQKESIDAVSFLGLKENDIEFLGYPDGLLYKLQTARQIPLKSEYTCKSETYGIYKKDFHSNYFGHPGKYIKKDIIFDLLTLVNEYQPKNIYIPHIADTHLDHKATNYFALQALNMAIVKPQIYFYLVHSKNKELWPNPKWPQSRFTPKEDINNPNGYFDEEIKWPPDINLKLNNPFYKLIALEFYQSVKSVDQKNFITAFVKKNESYWKLFT